MKRARKLHLRTIFVIVLVLYGLIASFYAFRHRMEEKIQLSEETHLAESAKAASEIFYIKLDDQLTMLESQARYFQSIDLSDYNVMKSTIMSTKGIGEFKNIGVANASGATINYNGTSSGNVLLSDYYKAAMKGNHAISKSTIIDEDGDEVLVLAVPIVKESGVEGIIYGTFTKDTLNNVLESISNSEFSSNILFNRDGKILAASYDNIIKEGSSTVTDVIPNANISGISSNPAVYFKSDGEKYIALITPIGIHDWYFTSIIPETVVSDQITQITIAVGIMIGVIIVLFLVILLHIISLIRNTDMITDLNERFRLVNDQSHNIIFSYNYKTGKLTIDGNAAHIIEKTKLVYNHDDAMNCLKLIHKEDIHICQAILALKDNNQSVVQGEMRMKNLNDSYYWYRMNATVIRDEKGNPVQLLGSVFDVDEQRSKEIELLEQASTDSLTGILNKGAFKKAVGKTIAAAPSMLALYIIDLDNFKAVNDNLGHAMGDKVLTDVADKLSEIFGSKECVGRIGGDEFSAFYIDDDLTEEKVIERAGQICKRMEETYSSFATEVHVSVSVGVAIFPTYGRDYDTLYRNADKALYIVKGSGKNMYSLYKKGVTGNEKE